MSTSLATQVVAAVGRMLRANEKYGSQFRHRLYVLLEKHSKREGSVFYQASFHPSGTRVR